MPQAVQVADRWHLMENASRAFLKAVRKWMRQIRVVIGATTIGPNLLTAAERPSMRAIVNRLFNCGLLSTFLKPYGKVVALGPTEQVGVAQTGRAPLVDL
ncbi:hypothetical protein [Bradyrhizobium sp. CCBAU 45389]|uniref:hypothetical protein n=1 Tax=Bradyrhizobium sp. CCBAU 45389 TaxID=858429 RepID=UPI002304F804|nr:hypothetical protein [Bradyrhizobium sp. CCBAU 45389]